MFEDLACSRETIMTPHSGPESEWVPDKSLMWLHRFGFNILKRGSLPKHIAIVMDGNRRFAKKKGVEKNEGHEKGFSKLTETLQWCLDLGILEVTVFAFSIENFKRSQEEVDTLMSLAREKFRKLISEWRKLRENGVCVRVVGDLTLVPKDLLVLFLIAMLLTKDNKRACLNIAFSYTGKAEMTSAAGLVIHGLRSSKLNDTTANSNLIDQCLFTYLSPPPELIIRTSGEHRLSDFLSWQGADSYSYFVNVLWPDFSVWNFICSILYYQHFVRTCQNRHSTENKCVREFVNLVQENRLREVVNVCECEGQPLNWSKMCSFTKDELYAYYVEHFSSPL